jgi:hypothetical protein
VSLASLATRINHAATDERTTHEEKGVENACYVVQRAYIDSIEHKVRHDV